MQVVNINMAVINADTGEQICSFESALTDKSSNSMQDNYRDSVKEMLNKMIDMIKEGHTNEI